MQQERRYHKFYRYMTSKGIIIPLKGIIIPLSMLFVIGLSTHSRANNLLISNVAVSGSNVTFTISWDASWRTSGAPNNMDAVWLFVKKKDCSSGAWSHVNLSPTTTDHLVGSPLEIYIDGKDSSSATLTKGVFVRRSAVGTGNISGVAVSLQMTGLSGGNYDFKVFGIEMVQIPQGAFYLGDGGHPVTAGFNLGGNTTACYTVTSEAAITGGNSGTNLGSSGSTTPSNLAAAYPKGYNEIYCMKYEISQGQYVDFLNTLTSTQAVARTFTVNANRENISGTSPTVTATTIHRAMNYLSYIDLLSYLDWSALRPMTELEFEKICRGPVYPASLEYAWGTVTITDANTIAAGTDGTPTENVTDPITANGGIANYGNSSVLGPLRCGFAAKAGTTRLTAGAGYYGVMELSGNLSEPTISTCCSVGGITFTGLLGDGALTASGVYNVTNWTNPATTPAYNAGLRGGSWADNASALNISDRSNIKFYVDATHYISRYNYIGGRGVR